MTKYEYTWIDGKFYIRVAGSKRWQHLSEFPQLALMDRTMSNERMIALAEANGEATLMFSEGWCLHQQWLASPFYTLVSNK